MTAPGDLPSFAAWQHVDARRGFEVVFVTSAHGGHRLDGATSAVEDETAWAVHYSVTVDSRWHTVRAEVTGRSAAGRSRLVLEHDGHGRWLAGGAAVPLLDGCHDVDLESSAMTNALPVRRLRLEIGERADVPAAYVRAVDLSVSRLEQEYLRLEDVDGCERYRYRAPSFDFECELVYDRSGLVLDYPGLATRARQDR